MLPRAGTKAEFLAANRIYDLGEMCRETDTGVVRFGDGVSRYKNLKPFTTHDQLVATHEDTTVYAHELTDDSGAILLATRASDGHTLVPDLDGLSVQEIFARLTALIGSADDEFLVSLKDADGKPIAMFDRAGRLILGGIDDSVQAMLNASTADIAYLKSITDLPYEQPVPNPLYVDTPPDVVIGGGGHDAPLSVLVPSSARVGGRSWAAWYQNDDIAGEGPGDYCVLAFSDDDWVTSTEYAYIVHPDPTNRIHDPILSVDPTGKLWLTFSIIGNNEREDGLSGVWVVTIKNPLASFPSISTPFRLSYYGVASYPTIINEQMVLPIDYWRYGKTPLVPSETGKKLFRLHYEDRKIEPFSTLPENAGHTSYDETNIVQLPNGKLMAVYRSRSTPTDQDTERVMGEIDKDGVVTWGEPETYAALGLAASSRIWCGLTPTGRLAICYNNSANRDNLVVKLSDDYGETFPYSVQLSNTLEVSYPALTFDDAGNIYVTHDQNRITDRLILCEIVSEAAIVAGTATVTTRTIANKGN